MIAATNQIVTIHFKIKDHSGILLETTEHDGPISFVQGAGSLLADVEQALEGKCIGEEIRLQLPPERAFGHINPELKQVVALGDLDLGDTPLEVGEGILLDDDSPVTWTVNHVEGEQVYLDGNHPYAGKTLDFWVRIVEIKDSEKTKVSDDNTSSCGPGCCCD